MLAPEGVAVVSPEQAALFATRQIVDLESRVVEVDVFVQNPMPGAAEKLGFGERRSRPYRDARRDAGVRTGRTATGALYQEER